MLSQPRADCRRRTDDSGAPIGWSGVPVSAMAGRRAKLDFSSFGPHVAGRMNRDGLLEVRTLDQVTDLRRAVALLIRRLRRRWHNSRLGRCDQVIKALEQLGAPSDRCLEGYGHDLIV